MRFQLTLSPYFLYVILCLIVLNSCKKTLEEEKVFAQDKTIEGYILSKKWEYTSENGIYHAVRVPAYGYQVAYGDTVTFWYKGYTLNGEVFETNIKSVAKLARLDTTVRSFDPLVVVAGKGILIGGLDDGLLLSCEKEQATILFTSANGFGKDHVGPIKPWSPLAYDIEIVKLNSKNIRQEQAIIDNLDLLGDGFTKDTSGLYYKTLPLGPNPKPAATDSVWGWYKGTLPDGTVVDLSVDHLKFSLSDKNIPMGVRLGFMLTQKGGSTDLVLPSYLGFGIKGEDGLIKPYQTLKYKIRLDSIKLNK
jgi:FKBP-type peptidyl-prolyl cis-trans isomerase